MTGEIEAVVQHYRLHYGLPRLVQRLLDGLRTKDQDVSCPTAADLRSVDQFHDGGLTATEAMAAFAGVAPGLRVLDAGSGLGGTSRYLAETFGVTVEAVDLTPEFIKAAEKLNRTYRLAGLIRSQVGNVTALPFGPAEFDLVWSHNVAMNVSDKVALLSEAFRVLRPGGRLVIACMTQGPNGPPFYPVPWAREPSYSFLDTPEALFSGLQAAGFQVVKTRVPSRGSRLSGRLARTADLGDDIAQCKAHTLRSDNAIRSVAEGRVRPILALALKA